MTLGVSVITFCKEYNILRQNIIICKERKDESKSYRLCFIKQTVFKHDLGSTKQEEKKGLKLSGAVTLWYQKPAGDIKKQNVLR